MYNVETRHRESISTFRSLRSVIRLFEGQAGSESQAANRKNSRILQHEFAAGGRKPLRSDAGNWSTLRRRGRPRGSRHVIFRDSRHTPGDNYTSGAANAERVLRGQRRDAEPVTMDEEIHRGEPTDGRATKRSFLACTIRLRP